VPTILGGFLEVLKPQKNADDPEKDSMKRIRKIDFSQIRFISGLIRVPLWF
jgi:hypothetical protein